MTLPFIDRTTELDTLRERLTLGSPPFIVLVGRRRVGKTRLVHEFLRGVENSIYLFVEVKKPNVLLNDFSRMVGHTEGIVFENWEGFLRYALNRYDVVVMDEFQNIDRVDPSFFTALQKVLDREEHRAMLMAVGSYVGMMKRIFEDKRSPLFGRAAEIWNLPPLPAADILRTLEGDWERRFLLYSMFGGYPKYYVILDQYGVWDPETILKELVIRRFSPLNREPYHLLMLEFGGEYRTFFSLLEAIARGKCEYGEIAKYTGISTTTLARYLDDLLRFEVIEKRFPVTEGPGSRKTRYFIRDQFVGFWFRYLYPHLDLIEIERYDELARMILPDLPVFISREFERIVRGVLRRRFRRVGQWWNRRGDEIDAVAMDDDARTVLFVEMKWTARKIGWDVVKGLQERSELFPRMPGYARSYLIVSKSGFTTHCMQRMEDAGIHSWDLAHLCEVVLGNREPDL